MAHPDGSSFAKRVGGRLCLDFTNTVGGRIGNPGGGRARDYGDRVVEERLGSYEDLLRWGAVAGAMTEAAARALAREEAARPGEAAAVLVRGLALREATYRLVQAALEGWAAEPEDVAVLNQEVQAARRWERLVPAPRFHWEWEATTPPALDRVLWPVAASAAELLTSADLERVRRCPGEACGWLFLDTSRSQRRRWCDMADCGNLAKVRGFRQRRHPPG